MGSDWGKFPAQSDSGETLRSKETGKMKSMCGNCKLHAWAERKPDSFLARLWRWHTKWCPGWKAYQKELAESGTEPQGEQAEEKAE